MGKIEQVVHPFEPVFDEKSEILILGSFPSVISRKQNFYYANKNNRFWKVMEILSDEKIENPKQFCLQHHIALWDVIHSCSIQGSSDASISDVVVNPIDKIVRNSNIHTIFLTGKKAEMLYRKYINLSIEAIGLPSTSSANASLRLPELVEAYRIVWEKL